MTLLWFDARLYHCPLIGVFSWLCPVVRSSSSDCFAYLYLTVIHSILVMLPGFDPCLFSCYLMNYFHLINPNKHHTQFTQLHPVCFSHTLYITADTVLNNNNNNTNLVSKYIQVKVSQIRSFKCLTVGPHWIQELWHYLVCYMKNGWLAAYLIICVNAISCLSALFHQRGNPLLVRHDYYHETNPIRPEIINAFRLVLTYVYTTMLLKS